MITGIELAKVIAHLKGSSARKLNLINNTHGSIWQPAYYDHALRNEEDRLVISRYIIANPVRKNIVSSVKDYPYWNSVYL
jgi:putative transposase